MQSAFLAEPHKTWPREQRSAVGSTVDIFRSGRQEVDGFNGCIKVAIPHQAGLTSRYWTDAVPKSPGQCVARYQGDLALKGVWYGMLIMQEAGGLDVSLNLRPLRSTKVAQATLSNPWAIRLVGLVLSHTSESDSIIVVAAITTTQQITAR